MRKVSLRLVVPTQAAGVFVGGPLSETILPLATSTTCGQDIEKDIEKETTGKQKDISNFTANHNRRTNGNYIQCGRSQKPKHKKNKKKKFSVLPNRHH